MGRQSDLFKPYRAAQQGDWDSLKDFYEKNVGLLASPQTVAKDNAFHLAVLSKGKEPLQFLLDISEKDPTVKYVCFEQNGYGDTPLHEAAASGNLEAVKALVDHYSKLLKDQNEDVIPVEVEKDENKFLEAVNNKGETPLFKAAAFGRIEMVKFLASKSLSKTRFVEQGVEREVTKLKSVHYQNQRILPSPTEGETSVKMPDASILHVAIRGHHFDTALYLLDLDESLATLKDPNGRTSLHLLATMPSAFQGKIRALAMRLAEKLIEKDSSWDDTVAKEAMIYKHQPIGVSIQAKGDYTTIPLLLATERGIVEIVKKILEVYPPLVEHENDLNQNILHVAIKHRQSEIFDLVKNMEIPMTRLARKVDKNGYTILHHTADIEEETKKFHPAGPVYQLQEEIKWYKRVEKIMPPHYADLRDKKHDMTCNELFKMKHVGLLKQAQDWIKNISRSCSIVAVLVATVVFAAAYTVPGGFDKNGYPVFLNRSLFLAFATFDAIALAFALSSVLMFLSILTSSCTYNEFLLILPARLTQGFNCLFASLFATMVVFGATISLMIHSKKLYWVASLLYMVVAFEGMLVAVLNYPICVLCLRTLPELLEFYCELFKKCCVTKSSQPKTPAAGQGSIADQAAPKNPIAYRAASERQSIV